jgi:hypothetical protein
MKLQELQTLAQKVQLKLKPEETTSLLTDFLELEKLLVDFHRLKLRTKINNRAKKTEINLKILRQLSRKYSPHLTKQKVFQWNASSTSAENFLLLPKTY